LLYGDPSYYFLFMVIFNTMLDPTSL
jgi:hypothetical protein